jgi:hypothetical protein
MKNTITYGQFLWCAPRVAPWIRRISSAILVLVLLLGVTSCKKQVSHSSVAFVQDSHEVNLAILEEAFENQRSGFFVEAGGIVEKIVPDDMQGNKHQRFIVSLENGQSLLIVHNSDIAPRILQIKKGDYLIFRGKYEWNDKGGIIHWTHHDPEGKILGGWIEYKGKRYQ